MIRIPIVRGIPVIIKISLLFFFVGGGGGGGGNQDSTSKIFPQSGCHRKKISRMLESGILY